MAIKKKEKKKKPTVDASKYDASRAAFKRVSSSARNEVEEIKLGKFRGRPEISEGGAAAQQRIMEGEGREEFLKQKPEVEKPEDQSFEDKIPVGFDMDMFQINKDFQAKADGKKPLEEMALYQQALLSVAATGGIPTPGQFNFAAGDATSKAITSANSMQKAAQPGVKFTPVTGNAAESFATNGKSLVKTSKWLLANGFNMKTAPLIMGAIGSYPFAGFIKEEALQTLSFGVLSAKQSGDLVQEEEALNQLQEVLDPSTWNKIVGAIPYVNVLGQLNTFYEAARKKLDIDRESFEKRKSL